MKEESNLICPTNGRRMMVLQQNNLLNIWGAKWNTSTRGLITNPKLIGMMYKEQIYSPSENRLYNVVDDSDTLIWINGAINSDTVVSYSIQETDEVILGYECQVFIVETTNGTGKYFFSKDLKVDPENFKDHHYGNFALVSSQTQSVSLRVEIDNDTLNIIYEAVEITEMNLDDSFFRIPDLPSKETPYY